MKNKKFKIDIPIYKMQFHVWICSAKQADEWYKKTWYYDNDGTSIFRRYGGKTLSAKGVDPIIWVDSTMSRNDKISALVHELLHAILYQMTDKGSVIDSADNAEHYTYLIEYCVKTILDKAKIIK